VVRVFGPARLGVEQVVEGEIETFRQPPDGPVAGVDQLTSPLGYCPAAK
jgi:hypothetical protein